MKKIFTVAGVILMGCITAKINAQNFWKRTDEKTLTARNDLFSKTYRPAQFVSFQLDEDAFRNQLKSAPSEKNISAGRSSFIISVPVSSGATEKFKVVEAPVMEAGLAAKHPEIKTYAGQGIDDPSSTIRFDITPEGFHGMILSAVRKTIYINPVDKENHIYIAFDRDHLSNSDQIFDCKTAQVLGSEIQGRGNAGKNANDGELRVYRFAVASGGEFSKLIYTNTGTDADKKAQVLAVLVTDLTRVDGVMEADFGVRLDYVNNEDTIIFLNGATDPFLSSASGINNTWNTQAQTTITNYIGSANYDIGHLLMGYNTGGNAGCIGCVCKTGNKGAGATGSTSVSGDPFVIDFWIHEIGHQFGDNHTFDYSNEGTIAQMEPGSGITIMGYAGVTGTYDIAKHSIPFFHGISIQQATDYIMTGAGSSCGTMIATGDNAPSADAGLDYTIPSSTPFMLTAKATDADVSDVLTYDWEQFDDLTASGSSPKPKVTTVKGPVFRPYSASISPIRTLPVLTNILDGSNTNTWEKLPSVARNLNFRVTVRDNHPGGGQNNSDDMKVTVDATSGPFKVTVANTTGVIVQGGSNYTVTWDVANTTAVPVSCSDVDIILSTDGGVTFTDTLASGTPNNGSAIVIAPNINASSCRIMVKSVGNIFFDINDVNFSITATLPLNWLSFTGQLKGAATLLNWSTTNEVNNNYFIIERSTDAVHYSSIGTVNATATPVSVNPYAFTDKNPLTGTNFYRLKQFDKDGNYHYSSVVKIIVGKNGGSWIVYPNPATTLTSIAVKYVLNNVTVSLANARGQIVYNTSMQKADAGQIINVPVGNLAKGVYILKVKSDEEIRTEKIVVE